MTARLLAIASTLGSGFSDRDILRTRAVVRGLSDEVKDRSKRA
jgi:hypothetical protein